MKNLCDRSFFTLLIIDMPVLFEVVDVLVTIIHLNRIV